MTRATKENCPENVWHDPSQLPNLGVTQSLVITEDTSRRLAEIEDQYLKRRVIYM